MGVLLFPWLFIDCMCFTNEEWNNSEIWHTTHLSRREIGNCSVDGELGFDIL